MPERLTQERYPSNRLQVIPTFSLYWVSMIYDYWMLRKDDSFLKQFLNPARGILELYEKNIDPSKKMLGPMKWWNFTDWDTAFANGVPDGAIDGNSSVVTLQYVYTLEQAARVFAAYGKTNEAAHFSMLANELKTNTYCQCFDKEKGEIANTPEKKIFSQHAGIMGVLTGAVPAKQMKQVMQKVLTNTSLSQATFYYRFYLTWALKKAGMADLYYSQLKPWRDMFKKRVSYFCRES